MTTPHPRLSVSQVCTWDWTLEQDLAFWAEEGIDHVGLLLPKLDAHGRDDAVERITEAGLRVSNLTVVGLLSVAEPLRWGAQRQHLIEALGLAAELGAGCLLTTTGPLGGLTWEAAAEKLGELLEPVQQTSERVGVPLALEHTNHLRADLSFLHSLRDAAELAGDLDTQVVAEVTACWGERGLADTAKQVAPRTALVQLSDFELGTVTSGDRRVPGDGDLPLEQFVGHWDAAGYTGPFDLEFLGPRIRDEGYASAVRRGVAAASELLRGAGR